MTARRGLAMAAALAVLAAAGGALAQGASRYVVTMADMSYGPLPANLKVGDTIVWTNRDTVPHTVTARDHSFDLRIAPGKSAPMTLQKPGTFAFYCTYHTMMRGKLTVAAK
jgi:plastocyanin